MLNSKLTGALAWGGLALILAVPSADYLTKASGGAKSTPQPMTSTSDPVTTASVSDGATSIKVPVIHAAPVPMNGRPMPSYISDPEPEAATTPKAPTVPKVQTATVAPEPVAPVPMPAHMRPLPPTAQQPAQPAPQVATVAPPPVSAQGQPLILDETQVLANEAALNTTQPKAPAQNPNVPRPPALVTEDQLQDWDSGSLADYLEQRGLLSDASYNQTNVRRPPADENYDADGFYLSDGPNGQQQRVRRDADGNLIIPAN